jgi:hypothetical protein
MPGEKPCENDPDKGLRCAGVFQSDFRIRKEIKMSNYRWIKLLAVLSLLVAVLAVNAVSAGLVKADEDDDQSEEVTVITVPSGDVDALYAAVYDENGRPRDNVEIVLEPGVFFLEEESLEGEARPFGGSLVLGDNTILRSTLDLPLNEDGVPTGEDPCPTGEESVCGAIIDGGNLPSMGATSSPGTAALSAALSFKATGPNHSKTESESKSFPRAPVQHLRWSTG